MPLNHTVLQMISDNGHNRTDWMSKNEIAEYIMTSNAILDCVCAYTLEQKYITNRIIAYCSGIVSHFINSPMCRISCCVSTVYEYIIEYSYKYALNILSWFFFSFVVEHEHFFPSNRKYKQIAFKLCLLL